MTCHAYTHVPTRAGTWAQAQTHFCLQTVRGYMTEKNSAFQQGFKEVCACVNVCILQGGVKETCQFAKVFVVYLPSCIHTLFKNSNQT